MGQLQTFKMRRKKIQNTLLKYIFKVILKKHIEIVANLITFLNFRNRNLEEVRSMSWVDKEWDNSW